MARQPAVSYWLTTVLERNTTYLKDVPESILKAQFSDDVRSRASNSRADNQPLAAKRRA